MPEMIRITCPNPNCNKRLKFAPTDVYRKKSSCPKCGTRFRFFDTDVYVIETQDLGGEESEFDSGDEFLEVNQESLKSGSIVYHDINLFRDYPYHRRLETGAKTSTNYNYAAVIGMYSLTLLFIVLAAIVTGWFMAQLNYDVWPF
ncbi:MAG TPA: IBR domain-containing protein [Pirellulaceae bacterium]|nr:IBR domain-containing protein [Pirellulaceae bacterium]HMO93210.1 IBR domain-containing protein [Pirellulaceae bacterium]HMP70041.1 IBR domain-containing protein [Pirellulaceae bacterium]